MQVLDFRKDFTEEAISPNKEMAAYEALWLEKGASFKTIASKFERAGGATPSAFLTDEKVVQLALRLKETLKRRDVARFGVCIHGTTEYPESLRDADHPLELFYYQGWWDLVHTPSVAVVGARKVTEEGRRRAVRLTRHLVEDGFTVVSGLAEGVDTAAHNAALEMGGKTIAVIGTPLSHFYPKQNRQLQEHIAKEHLIISQVPFLHYEERDYRSNRQFFPARNVTMSALSQATVIVEASDTSGTLYQARAALKQGRKLFILDSCFRNNAIKWPAKYQARGAIRVKDYDDIRSHLHAHDKPQTPSDGNRRRDPL
ncbi:DNA-processing protein DprA [Microbulbifer sp. TYP-18]|uniref:DNA-processing protein DprA n=1 Tax=Microbulbifer sp. TYP-18 TaxID=3230024 RepID=UPI0034C66565